MNASGALRAVILFCLLAAAAPQKAQQIRVGAQIHPAKLAVGDRATLTVTFTTAPEILVTHSFSATEFGDWELLEISPVRNRPRKDGSADRAFQLLMIPWSATVTATPALPFKVELPGQWEKTIIVAPQRVEMESVLAKAKDTGDLRPLRGLIGYRSLLPFLIAGVLLVSGALVWFVWRKRKQNKGSFRTALPPRPAAKLAREALERLLASDLLARGETKLFYTALSEIPRRYIEGRFGIPALDRTTPELLPELRRRPELRELYADIRRFLESCDLVKFAKHAPAEQDIRQDVACARRFVETTSSLDLPPEKERR